MLDSVSISWPNGPVASSESLLWHDVTWYEIIHGNNARRLAYRHLAGYWAVKLRRFCWHNPPRSWLRQGYLCSCPKQSQSLYPPRIDQQMEKRNGPAASCKLRQPESPSNCWWSSNMTTWPHGQTHSPMIFCYLNLQRPCIWLVSHGFTKLPMVAVWLLWWTQQL